MSDVTESNTSQPRSRLKGVAKKTVKRLDFAMRRPTGKAAAKPTPVAKPAPVAKPTPKPVAKPTLVAKPAPKPTARPASPKPAKTPPAAPVKPVMANHGRFIDFAPSRVKKPLTAPESKLSAAKPTPVAKPALRPRPAISRPAQRPAQRPAPTRPAAKPAARPAVRPTAPRPTPKSPARPAAKPTPKPIRKLRPAPAPRPLEPEPLLSDDDFAAALSGHGRPDITPDTFDEELDALDSISDDIFDDIDAADNALKSGDAGFVGVSAAGAAAFASGFSTPDDIDSIEREIEADANDFIKAPKPLFEDPLVMLSKVRDERRHKKEAKAAAEFKERTKEEAKKASYLAPYTLGGRSPFLSSVNVEKRPLSAPGSALAGATTGATVGASAAKVANGPLTAAGAAAKSAKASKAAKSTSKTAAKFASKFTSKSAKSPKVRWTAKNPADSPVKLQAPGSALMENAYRAQMKNQLDRDAKEIHRQTMMATTPDGKTRRPGLIIAVILTVLLGAGVGAVIYLIFFQ